MSRAPATGRGERDGDWEREMLREFVEDLRRRGDGAFLRGDGGEGLRELGVAFVLAGGGLRQGLIGGGEIGGELGAVATVSAPGDDDGDGEGGGDEEFGDAEWDSVKHGFISRRLTNVDRPKRQ